MPKYSMRRKINLGRFGLDYESVDIEVSDCETRSEAMQEVSAWKAKLFELAKEENSQLREAK